MNGFGNLGASNAVKAWRSNARSQSSRSGAPLLFERPNETVDDFKRVVDDHTLRATTNLFTPQFPLSTCGQPGGLPCMVGTPQSGLSGLGLVNVALCSPFETAVETLGLALERANAVGVSSAAIHQAQQRYDQETTYALWNRSVVTVANCSVKTAEILQLIYGVNASLPNPVIIPAGVTDQGGSTLNPPPPTDVAGTVKTVAIAAAIIAGAVILAPIVFEAVGWSKLARSRK